MSPQKQRQISRTILELIDKHPHHNSVDAILRCQQGCAQKVHEHLAKIEKKFSKS